MKNPEAMNFICKEHFEFLPPPTMLWVHALKMRSTEACVLGRLASLAPKSAIGESVPGVYFIGFKNMKYNRSTKYSIPHIVRVTIQLANSTVDTTFRNELQNLIQRGWRDAKLRSHFRYSPQGAGSVVAVQGSATEAMVHAMGHEAHVRQQLLPALLYDAVHRSHVVSIPHSRC